MIDRPERDTSLWHVKRTYLGLRKQIKGKRAFLIFEDPWQMCHRSGHPYFILCLLFISLAELNPRIFENDHERLPNKDIIFNKISCIFMWIIKTETGIFFKRIF